MNNRCSGTRASAVGDGQTGQRGSVRQSIGAQLELPPSRGHAWFGAAHPQRLLELQRLRPEVNPEESRGNDRAEEDHARIAEDVADRIRDCDVRNKPCAVRFGHGQSIDRVRGRSHRRTVGEGTRQEPCREAWIQPQRFRNKD